MTYITADDLRQRSVKPWAHDIVIGEADADNARLDSLIAQVTLQVELDLGDDFEPPGGDADETIKIDSYGGDFLTIPRRVRSITTLQTRQAGGTTMTTQTAFYHRRSLNAAGTAMATDETGRGRKYDRLEALPGLCWPYGQEMVWITGKFGWSAVPDDIKRLVGLRVYELAKPNGDVLSRIQQRITLDSTVVYGPSREMTDIVARYQRAFAFVG